ncbi:uncharacterized protein LOC144512317 [Sander vitreus]
MAAERNREGGTTLSWPETTSHRIEDIKPADLELDTPEEDTIQLELETCRDRQPGRSRQSSGKHHRSPSQVRTQVDVDPQDLKYCNAERICGHTVRSHRGIQHNERRRFRRFTPDS